MENEMISSEAVNDSPADTAANLSLTGRLLAMANRYRNEKNLRQATEIYWTLVEKHPGTIQAGTARSILLNMADEYECNNARHMARSIIERLMGQGN